MKSTYHTQLAARPPQIDLDFWSAPEGVSVPDDELRFLLVPDAVQTLAVNQLAQQVHAFQRDNLTPSSALTHALMVTMGGMPPGILLYDHLVFGSASKAQAITFGTIGASLYKGPNERFAEPQVTQAASVDITDGNVLLIDDLGDRGDTLIFLAQHLGDAGARRVMTLVLYIKPLAKTAGLADFYFGEVEQETWIITPRELIETLMKRVPLWKARGATEAECRRRLVELIGYPQYIVDHYLARAYAQG